MLMYAVSLEHQGRGRAIRKELQGAFMKGGKVIFTEGVAFMLARGEGGRCIADDSIDHPFWRLLVRGHPFDSQLPGVERRPLPEGKGVSPSSVAGPGRKLGNDLPQDQEIEFG